MKNKIIRTFTVTLAAVLCLTAFSTTAFAGGTDPNPEPLPETTEDAVACTMLLMIQYRFSPEHPFLFVLAQPW